jgi:predicted Zn-dependent protease
MFRATRIFIFLSVGILTACALNTRWDNLPPPRQGVFVHWLQGDDESVKKAWVIVQRLARAKPLPVERVFVLTADHGNATSKTKTFSNDNAGAFRCGRGDPPPNGCVYVGGQLLRNLSDDALAGVLAHELGHLEKGHRNPVYREIGTAKGMGNIGMDLCGADSGGTAAGAVISLIGCGIGLVGTAGAAGFAVYSRDTEREADASGLERLAAAGYCAGPTMRKTAVEMSRLHPQKQGLNVFSSHPGWRERWENAGSDCGSSVVSNIPTPVTTKQAGAQSLPSRSDRVAKWQVYNDAGANAYRQGQYDEAETSWQNALKEAEGIGAEDQRVAISLTNLARLHVMRGKYSEAESLYQRSVTIWEKTVGPEHRNLAVSLNGLAAVYHRQHRYGEAEPLHKRSLAIQEKILGFEHPDTATSLMGLASAYAAQNKYSEAEPLYKRGLAVYEKAFGSDHPNLAVGLQNYATLLRRLNRVDEAEELEGRVKAIRAKAKENENK